MRSGHPPSAQLNSAPTDVPASWSSSHVRTSRRPRPWRWVERGILLIVVAEAVHGADNGERPSVEEALPRVHDLGVGDELAEAPVHLVAVKRVLVLAGHGLAAIEVVLHCQVERVRGQVLHQAVLDVHRVEVQRHPDLLFPVLHLVPPGPHEDGPLVAVDGHGRRVHALAGQVLEVVHVPHEGHVCDQAVGEELPKGHHARAQLAELALAGHGRALLGPRRVKAEAREEVRVEARAGREHRVAVLHRAEHGGAQQRPPHEREQVVRRAGQRGALRDGEDPLLVRLRGGRERRGGCGRRHGRRRRGAAGVPHPRREGLEHLLLVHNAQACVLQHGAQALHGYAQEGRVRHRGGEVLGERADAQLLRLLASDVHRQLEQLVVHLGGQGLREEGGTRALQLGDAVELRRLHEAHNVAAV
mmetsp:Transcript_14955/g.50420  ORF Transcript_14955/g.50420 Transcript_14955/m.50420 type:complete len:416 (+) Transcript_14955:166-1413(+)